MESTPQQVVPGSVGPTRPGLRARRSAGRRRPTGEPPPLPRSIQPTGVWWVAAAVVLVTLARITFGWARDSLGMAVTVWDDAVVGWLAGLRLPGLTRLMEAIVASTGSVGMVGALRWATVVALLVLRRFRHLVVFVGSLICAGTVWQRSGLACGRGCWLVGCLQASGAGGVIGGAPAANGEDERP